jgi:hypothetical protein
MLKNLIYLIINNKNKFLLFEMESDGKLSSNKKEENINTFEVETELTTDPAKIYNYFKKSKFYLLTYIRTGSIEGV